MQGEIVLISKIKYLASLLCLLIIASTIIITSPLPVLTEPPDSVSVRFVSTGNNMYAVSNQTPPFSFDIEIVLTTSEMIGWAVDNQTSAEGISDTISFNSTVLNCTGISLGDFNPDGAELVGAIDNLEGKIRGLAAYTVDLNATDVSGEGVIVTISFDCISSGMSEISFNALQIVNNKGSPPNSPEFTYLSEIDACTFICVDKSGFSILDLNTDGYVNYGDVMCFRGAHIEFNNYGISNPRCDFDQDGDIDADDLLEFVTGYNSYLSGSDWELLSRWSYKKSHIINKCVGAGTDYQVKILTHFSDGTDEGSDVYLDEKCQPDFDDIRFSDSAGFLLDYWMEELNEGDSAVFWVKIGQNLSTSDAMIYVYYGNDEAQSASDGKSTFIEFEDFSGDSTSMILYNQDPSRIEIRHDVFNDRLECNWKTSGSYIYIMSSAYWSPVTSGHALRMKYYRENPSDLTANKHYLMLFTEDYTDTYPPATTNDWVGYCIWSATSDWLPNTGRDWSSNDGELKSSSAYSISLDMWNVYEVTWTSNRVSTSWNDNQVWSISNSTFIPDEPLYPLIGGARGSMSNLSNFSAYWDWIFVRKCVDTEPSHGSWGIEETT